MEKIVTLRIIDSIYGEIYIPFLGLYELDLFTVRYNDRKELITALSRMLELPIRVDSVIDLKVCYKRDFGNEKVLPIKYRKDNFDIDSLSYSFLLYLKRDHERIRKTGVGRINTNQMCDFMAGEGHLTDFDIEVAVRLYLEDGSYKKYREIYFMIKDKVTVKKNEKVLKNSTNISRNLSKFDSDDDYISSLLQYALKGEEECEEVMEELSLMDLETLSSKIQNRHYGIFDGIDAEDYEDLRNLSDLEKYSGYSLEELIEIVSVKDKRRKRK